MSLESIKVLRRLEGWGEVKETAREVFSRELQRLIEGESEKVEFKLALRLRVTG